MLEFATRKEKKHNAVVGEVAIANEFGNLLTEPSSNGKF
jgi:hypothetical protein